MAPRSGSNTQSSHPTFPKFSFAHSRALQPVSAIGTPPFQPLSSRRPNTNLNWWFRHYHTIIEFFYGLVERSIDFRTTDSLPPRFGKFSTTSSPSENFLWYAFKVVFMVSVGIASSCVLYSLWDYAFGFEIPSDSFFMVVGVVILFLYLVACGKYFTDEVALFKLRIPVIGILSLDLQLTTRSTKTILVFFYSYLNLEERLGNHIKWGDVIVWFGSSFSTSAICMLSMYGHEFAHSRTLLEDFINVLIPLCLTQYFIKNCLMNAVIYLIPISVALISRYVLRYLYGPRYLYRPHMAGEAYEPTIPTISPADIAR